MRNGWYPAGGLAGAGVVALTAYWSAGRMAPGLVTGAVAPILLATNLGLAVWSLRGLETGLFTGVLGEVASAFGFESVGAFAYDVVEDDSAGVEDWLDDLGEGDCAA